MATPASEGAEIRRPVPYVSFSALRKLLERMVSEGAPPGRVDRTYLTGMSGGYQNQITAALRALGLVDALSSPTRELMSLVSNLEAELPAFMQRSIAILYPEANALAQRNGSAGQLADVFRSEYGIQGSTLENAIRFYLDACAFAGVPTGTHFKAPVRARKSPAKKVPQPKVDAPFGPVRAPADQPHPAMAMPSSTERVDLASGGHLVLTMAVDLFALDEKDRAFVFDIIDRVKGYKSERDAPTLLRDFDSE